MINSTGGSYFGLYGLVELIRFLRSSEGCPWDGRQTHQSIRRNLIEEAYEAAEAIDRNDPLHLREELGDLLVQVIFHTLIEEEKGGFTLDDVAGAESRKMIARHPQLFGGEAADWEELKRSQRGQSRTHQAMEGVSRALPALWRSEKVLKKAAGDGFQWPDFPSSAAKIREELGELESAESEEDAEAELGDLLLAVVGAAALRGMDPEDALNGATDKFIRRYRIMEEAAVKMDRPLSELSVAEKTALWSKARQSPDI